MHVQSSRQALRIAGALAILAAGAVMAQPALPAPSRAAASPGSSFTGTATGGSSSSGFTGSGTTGGSGEEEGDDGGSDDAGTSDDGGSLARPGSGVSNLDSAAVRRIQAALARLGLFHHVVTGYYGPVTTAAVKRFERSAGLSPDGIWGPLAAAALRQRLARG
jgi:putative peptidoglycan binding protein